MNLPLKGCAYSYINIIVEILGMSEVVLDTLSRLALGALRFGCIELRTLKTYKNNKYGQCNSCSWKSDHWHNHWIVPLCFQAKWPTAQVNEISRQCTHRILTNRSGVEALVGVACVRRYVKVVKKISRQHHISIVENLDWRLERF